MGNIINFERIWLLIKRDILSHKKVLWLYLAFGFVILIIINLFISFILSISREYTVSVYDATILIFLAVANSFAFYDLDFGEKAAQFFLAPATLLEKYIARFIITFFLFFFIGVIMKLLVYFVSYNSLKVIFSHYIVKGYFSYNIVNLFFMYLTIHAVYFFGSVFFKKNEFAKTILISACVILLIFIPDLEWFQGFIYHLFTGNWLHTNYYAILTIRGKYPELALSCNNLRDTLIEVSKYLLVPFLWVLGYFRLKEEEVRNGIQ